MKITITNDDGIVYDVATVINYNVRFGDWVVIDGTGDEVFLKELLRDAERWEKASEE